MIEILPTEEKKTDDVLQVRLKRGENSGDVYFQIRRGKGQWYDYVSIDKTGYAFGHTDKEF